MPIPVINYAAIPAQGDPFMRGLLPALQQGLELGFTPSMLRNKNKQQQLANALSQMQLEYQPKLNEADLAQKAAQLGLLQQESKFTPLKYLLDVAQNMRANSRFGSAYQLSNALNNMDEAARKIWIADHQDEYNQMLSDLGGQAVTDQSSGVNSVLARALKEYFPNTSLTIQPEEADKLFNSGMANVGNIPNTTTNLPNLNAPFANKPGLSDKLSKINTMAANQSFLTPQTKQQLEGAIIVGETMNNPSFRRKAMNAAQYAGAQNKGKQFFTKWFDNNKESYQDYISFMNQDMVWIKNKIKQLDGMGATDSQREELDNAFDKTMKTMSSDPEQFITQLDKLGESLETVAKSVAKAASPVAPETRIVPYKPISKKYSNQNSEQSGYSEDDLMHTAEQYGLTLDQVKQKLGLQ